MEIFLLRLVFCFLLIGWPAYSSQGYSQGSSHIVEKREGIDQGNVSTNLLLRNPLFRVCQHLGGLPWVVNYTDSGVATENGVEDEMVLCRFGEAAIGSEALMEFRESPQDVIRAYKFGQPYDCDIIRGQDSEGGSWGLCRFQDGSWIEQETLFRGPEAPENSELNRVLEMPALLSHY